MALFTLIIIILVIWYFVKNSSSNEQRNYNYNPSNLSNNSKSESVPSKLTSPTLEPTNSFQPQKSTKIEINITGPIPEKISDYRFYKFVCLKPSYILKAYYDEMVKRGHYFKPEFISAVNEKITTGKFENPINFDGYYNKTFDYISIDFETANSERISACKIGIAFILNDQIVNEDYHFIKPPKHIKFSSFNTNIHGITKNDVEDALDFKKIWDYFLKDYFNSNLIILHNSSMDASVLKQLFEYYKIEDFNINYVDTMEIAKKNGYPAKLIDLCELFDYEITNHHDPVEDAIACAVVASNFIEKGIDIKDYQKVISFSQPNNNENKDVKKGLVEKLIVKHELTTLNTPTTSNFFNEKRVVITGTFNTIERYEMAFLLQSKGAIITSSVSKKTDFVIVGNEPGLSKLEKIIELQSQGFSIQVLDEQGFRNQVK